MSARRFEVFVLAVLALLLCPFLAKGADITVSNTAGFGSLVASSDTSPAGFPYDVASEVFEHESLYTYVYSISFVLAGYESSQPAGEKTPAFAIFPASFDLSLDLGVVTSMTEGLSAHDVPEPRYIADNPCIQDALLWGAMPKVYEPVCGRGVTLGPRIRDFDIGDTLTVYAQSYVPPSMVALGDRGIEIETFARYAGQATAVYGPPPDPTPEPAGWLLLLTGGAAVWASRKYWCAL